ncbi:hypothetical conserved protein [Candidatus Nitrosoglobus terrae]|uniref:Hypothetical conserved protein n=1 Tax=Candidatus Nitrosoglobus terrae TaxID=1630141 RepID=A0A1Q2SLY2_9GAMM|nr:hypothetical protein [Candidatus Nitrosoglobus terrae]BAW80146.1 hypothetical conserved protein [Candidatus Nitrosoglobus terrae]
MSKLHFYRKINKHITWFADGEGTISESSEFTVVITDGSVIKGIVYQIIQGQSHSGDLYHCLAGANRGETARFKKVADLSSIYTNEEYLGAASALNAALKATEKRVNIEIAPEDFKTLKAGNYKLCFAKKIGNFEYNVVWQSYDKYFEINDFSWTPQFQIFGSNIFQEGVKVKTSTRLVNIGLGETITLSSAGQFGDPTTKGRETSITMINDYGLIHPGLSQLSTGVEGEEISTAIYVAPSQAVLGITELTPVEKVLVWFEQNIETSTMFSNARSREVEVDLTFVDSVTRIYKNGLWLK